MPTKSTGSKLREAALRLAAQRGGGLSFPASPGATTSFGYLPESCVEPGDRVVLIGAAGADALLRAAERASGTGSITLVERQSDRLDELKGRAGEAAEKLGYVNWRLVEAELDDLETDPAFVAEHLQKRPAADWSGYRELREAVAAQCADRPLVAEGSTDLVVLDGALNRLPASRTAALLREAFRVLRRGGRLVVNVLVADEPLGDGPLPAVEGFPPLRYVPLEQELFELLIAAGYYGMGLSWRAKLPLVMSGQVEIRALVLEAYKGKEGTCLDQGHAVVYRGPFSSVTDDDGHEYVRGERIAVCGKTFEILTRGPYGEHFQAIEPYWEVPADKAPLFDCSTPRLRDPKVTKGIVSVGSTDDCCGDEGCC